MFNARTLIYKTCQISKNKLSKIYSEINKPTKKFCSDINSLPLTDKIDGIICIGGICVCCSLLCSGKCCSSYKHEKIIMK